MADMECLSDIIGRKNQEQVNRELSGRRIKKVPPARKPVPFETWMKQIKKVFAPLAFAVEACASAMATLLLKDIGHCTTILLVDASSGGKTIVLNIVAGLAELAVTRDHLTGAAFVTNTSNVKKGDLSKLDLLPQIKGKVLICRDMAPIFSAREEDLVRVMGALTRILDGEGYETHTGTHGARGYSGDYCFVFLAATTPIQRRVWRAMSSLGPRILCLRLHSVEKTEEELAGQLLGVPYKEKVRICKEATSEFLKTVWAKYPEGVEWDQSKDPEACVRIIVRCAKLLCRLRGQVTDMGGNQWEDDDAGKRRRSAVRVHVVSMERPDRINQALYDTARGHALISGRVNLSMDDMLLVLRLTFDSIPEERWQLTAELIRCKGEMDTKRVELFLDCSNPTALRAMATLCALGICEEIKRADATEVKRIRLREEFEWFLTDECRDLLHHALSLPGTESSRSKQP
jgi:hypothetical protein